MFDANFVGLGISGTLLLTVCFTLGLNEHVILEHYSSQTIAKCEYLFMTYSLVYCMCLVLFFNSPVMHFGLSINGAYKGLGILCLPHNNLNGESGDVLKSTCKFL